MTETTPSTAPHVPVMRAEVLHLLAPRPGDTVVDGTLGAGGHSAAILEALDGAGLLVGIDRDPAMIEVARRRLGASAGARVELVHANYSEIDTVLPSVGGGPADGILLDLGVASPQIDQSERGFSYRIDGPLDMRMGPDAEMTAEKWINAVDEGDLADVLYRYGEERLSRRIARAIVRERQRSPIRRTTELAEIIARAVPGGPRRLHPARRSFQAIRIYLNHELDHLDRFLETLPAVLRPGGRCVVISYHSLEDRRVKTAFRAGIQEGQYEAVTRKPLRPAAGEIDTNPRSRSARVRAVRRAEGVLP